MIGYPFDSQVTFDQYGNPQYDRAVSSKPLKELIKKLFTTGVMPNPSTNLQVVAGASGLTTIVKAGFCIIEGGLKLEEEDKTMMHQAADTTYDRIDTVVMRWNDNDNARICALYVVAGTPSATPVRPTLNREGSVYEIGLADVLIKANSTAISQQRITDTRYESARCGIISSVSEWDTTTIYAQVQADLAGFKEDEEADFLAWFDEMKDQLSEDAAGHLQEEIGILDELETTEKSNLVGAVNEVAKPTFTEAEERANIASGEGLPTLFGKIKKFFADLKTVAFTGAISDLTGTLDATHGGTGQTSLQATRNAMGLGDTTGALPIANGGTGKTTAEDARTNLGLHDAAVKYVANNLTTTDSNHVLDARQGKELLDRINTWSSKGRCYKGSSNVQLDTTKKTTLFVYAVSGSTYYHATEIFPTDYLTSNFRNQNEGNAFTWVAGGSGGWAKVYFTVSATGVLAVYDSNSSAAGVWVPSITVYQK